METLYSDKEVFKIEDDKFNRYPFAKRIAETIKQRSYKECIVIGIYGQWGEGKSSVLNFITRELEPSHSNIVIVHFNPWRFADEDSLLRGFYDSLTNKIIESAQLDKLPKNRYSLRRQFDRISFLRTTKKSHLNTWFEDIIGRLEPIGKLADAVVSTNTGGLAKTISNVEIETLKTRFNAILKQENKHLVVVIDDIDRLDKEEAHAIFRLVKLNADFQNTTYILSFDDKMVSKMLGSKYGDDPSAGLNFLEKIVQVPLHLPKIHEEALRNYSIKLISTVIENVKVEFDESMKLEFAGLFSPYLLIRMTNPRMAIRYANLLNYSVPILEGEVNLVDLMVIEGIKIFYPQHYGLILENPQYFIGTYKNMPTNKVKVINDKLLELDKDYAQDEQFAIRELLCKIFPYLREALEKNIQINPEDSKGWILRKRICTDEYFDRYFNLSVREGDLSDKTFEALLNKISTVSEKDGLEEFAALFNKVNPNKLIQAFRLREERFSITTAIAIAKLLANVSDGLPNESGFFMGAFGQAVTFVDQLINRLETDERRITLMKDIFKNASSLPFCIYLFERIADKNRRDSISLEFKRTAFGLLLQHLQTQLPNDKFFEGVGGYHARYLFLKWPEFYERDSLASYLTQIFEQDAKRSLDYILIFTPYWTNNNNPKGFWGDFGNEEYNLIKTTFSPDLLNKYLAKGFGEQEVDGQPVFHDRQAANTEDNIIKQFRFMHSRMRNYSEDKTEE